MLAGFWCTRFISKTKILYSSLLSLTTSASESWLRMIQQETPRTRLKVSELFSFSAVKIRLYAMKESRCINLIFFICFFFFFWSSNILKPSAQIRKYQIKTIALLQNKLRLGTILDPVAIIPVCVVQQPPKLNKWIHKRICSCKNFNLQQQQQRRQQTRSIFSS